MQKLVNVVSFSLEEICAYLKFTKVFLNERMCSIIYYEMLCKHEFQMIFRGLCFLFANLKISKCQMLQTAGSILLHHNFQLVTTLSEINLKWSALPHLKTQTDVTINDYKCLLFIFTLLVPQHTISKNLMKLQGLPNFYT